MKNARFIIFVLALIAVFGGLLGYQSWLASQPSKYDKLAQCLADKGAKFYGAFWCPHCKQQKEFFGSAAKLLPYIECATPDGKGQNDTCTQAGIQSYPTWRFTDGSELSGEQKPEALAEKTGCAI